MPHVYVLNVSVLCLLIFPAMRWVLNRVISSRLKWLRSIMGVVGCLLLLSHVAFTVLLISTVVPPAVGRGVGSAALTIERDRSKSL